MIESLRIMLEVFQGLLGVYLRDPYFYLQLGLFVALTALALLLARKLYRDQWTLPGITWQPRLQAFYFPALGLLGGRLISSIFETQCVKLPIFERLTALFWVLLLYRAGTALVRRLYPEYAEVIRRRILLPLALLFVALRLIGQLGLFFRVLNQPITYIGRGTPQQIAITLPLLVLGPLAVLTIYAVADGMRTILTEDVLPSLGLRASRAYALGTLVSYAVAVIGILFVLAALGVSPSSLTVLGSALAVGIGFGLQNTVNNFVSGFLIMFDPLIQVGDTIEISNERGVIRYIGIRNSMIETADGTRVVMPNATLASSPVLNLTHSARLTKTTLLVPVSATADPHQVRQTLQALVAERPEIRQQPPPTITLLRLEANAMVFEIVFWALTVPEKATAINALNLAIWDALQRLGYALGSGIVPGTPPSPPPP